MGYGEVARFAEVSRILRDVSYRSVDDFSARGGMLLNLPEFLVGQTAGFIEHRVGNVDFSDIVKRRGINDIVDKLVGHLISVNSLALHLFHDYFSVGSGLFNVVAGALVAAFDHVGEHYYQTVLELCNLFALLLNLADVAHGV